MLTVVAPMMTKIFGESVVGYNNSNFCLKKYVLDRPEMGATTFSIITLSIKTLRIECNLNVVRLSVAIY
jgi:hypothetical protein